MSFIQLSIPTMDCRCSTVAFVALPAVMSLHLKLFKLCKLVCSVTKCQTQLETYPTGTSSVALHLKFLFHQKHQNHVEPSGGYRMFMDVPGPGSQVSQRLQDAIQFSWHSNADSFKNAQDMFVLCKEHKEETNTQSRKTIMACIYYIYIYIQDLAINLQLRIFWSCSPCRSGGANSSTLSWSLRLLWLGMTWLVMTVWQCFRKSPKIIQSWTSQKNCELSWHGMTCLKMTCIRTAVWQLQKQSKQ